MPLQTFEQQIRMLASATPGLPLIEAVRLAEAALKGPQHINDSSMLYMGKTASNMSQTTYGSDKQFTAADLGFNPATESNAAGTFLTYCPEVMQHYPNKKINAIKETRALLWIGLKEAKDAVEAFWPPYSFGSGGDYHGEEYLLERRNAILHEYASIGGVL